MTTSRNRFRGLSTPTFWYRGRPLDSAISICSALNSCGIIIFWSIYNGIIIFKKTIFFFEILLGEHDYDIVHFKHRLS